MGGCVKKPNRYPNNHYSEQDQIIEGRSILLTNDVLSQISINDKIIKNQGRQLYQYRHSQQNKYQKNQNIGLQNNVDKQNLPQDIISFLSGELLPQSNIHNKSYQNFDKIQNQQFNNSPLKIDFQKPFGIKNLSNYWIDQLKESSLFPEQIIKDPQSLIDVLSHFSHVNVQKSQIHSKSLITQEQFDNIIKDIHFIDENPANNYDFVEELGHGGASIVYKAISKNNIEQHKKQYAVKIYKTSDIQTQLKLKNQIASMKRLQSANIIKYIFCYYYKQTLFMFIQYMNGGSLTKFLIRYKELISQDIIAYILREILYGIKDIHSKGQIHRDLKSDNILLDTQGSIKIGDFGHTLQTTKDYNYGRNIVGTPAWMAPQLIRRQQYTNSVDIWSLGIVAIQLCKGQPPFLKYNQLKTMYMILSQPPPKITGCSPNLTRFIQACLQKNPLERSTVKQLLNHPFITHIGTGNTQKLTLKQMICRVKTQKSIKSINSVLTF